MCQAKENIDETDVDSIVEEIEDDWDDENNMVLRSKWVLDGAKSIDECIEKYQNFITFLHHLKSEGWELTNTIDDDYGFLRRTT